MTGQVLAAALLALVVVVALPPLLLRDLRAARYRRDPWWGWVDLGYTVDDQPPAWIMQAPIRVGYDEGLRRDFAALAIEYRAGLAVLRPEDYVKIVDVTP